MKAGYLAFRNGENNRKRGLDEYSGRLDPRGEFANDDCPILVRHDGLDIEADGFEQTAGAANEVRDSAASGSAADAGERAHVARDFKLDIGIEERRNLVGIGT